MMTLESLKLSCVGLCQAASVDGRQRRRSGDIIRHGGQEAFSLSMLCSAGHQSTHEFAHEYWRFSAFLRRGRSVCVGSAHPLADSDVRHRARLRSAPIRTSLDIEQGSNVWPTNRTRVRDQRETLSSASGYSRVQKIGPHLSTRTCTYAPPVQRHRL